MGTLVSLLIAQVTLAQGVQAPALEFPEAGLDDPAAYEGYATRFYRDSERNTIQVYIDGSSGRIVHVWADAANESAAVTVRGTSGAPAALAWGGAGATAWADGSRRSLRHAVRAAEPSVEIGWFLLGTMRKERDFQYAGWHRRPYDAPAFVLPELMALVEALGRLPAAERARHLSILGATSLDEVRARARPRVVLDHDGADWVVRVEHLSLDGRNLLGLELRGERARSEAGLTGEAVRVRSTSGEGVRFRVTVTTDSPALVPLERTSIFNDAFEAYYERQRRAGGDAFRRLERGTRALELISYDEKLLASLPNYATYFGRDMMMAAMMLEPVVTVDVQETVIGAMLGKLDPSGDVSHEEALGGQAIREAAAEYARLIGAWGEASAGGEAQAPSSEELLAQARAVLDGLQVVRENHHMVDDDLQLSVLTHRYLARADVPAARKRAFLEHELPGGGTRLDALVANLAFVAEMARPYARQPTPSNLVAFQNRDAGGWLAGSWRDSREGYGRGRFAMDVNVIWVPHALDALAGIMELLPGLGASVEAVAGRLERDATALLRYVGDTRALEADRETWRGARAHFEVELDPTELAERLASWFATLEPTARAFWEERLREGGAASTPLSFLAVALDEEGRPIPVVNTDPATELFLEDYTEQVLTGAARAADVQRMLDTFVRPYPVGLFVEGLGPLVANDVYADSGVQERFRADAYHSPTVVWGREVNLFFLGLARQIRAAYDPAGRLRDSSPEFAAYVRALRGTLEETRRAVEASGLRHNELWSYRIDEAGLRPVRYGTSSDIQLWNLTDLAVQFLVESLP